MQTAFPIDPVTLAQDLIRRPSVTPADAGAMDVLQRALEGLGFACRRLKFGEIENLYARRGAAGPNLCFAGHTDVVPPGEASGWGRDPFAGQVAEGVLHGRGAVDMKGGVAAFVAAVSGVLAQGEPRGSISFLITGDEEGEALDGTVKVVEALAAEGERIDHCIVGEPSSAEALGDMIKVGRRGSLNAWITVEGVQGHVAYPHRAANPVPVLVGLLEQLGGHRLDDGYPEFQPSNLEVTALETPAGATNVIPASASARLNIRFNPTHTGASLARWLGDEVNGALSGWLPRLGTVVGVNACNITLKVAISGEAFLTAPGPFTTLVQDAVEQTAGIRPVLSTTGGTSDARFIRALCPVIELGLVGTTMHQANERAPTAEIVALARIYQTVIARYFEAFA